MARLDYSGTGRRRRPGAVFVVHAQDNPGLVLCTPAPVAATLARKVIDCCTYLGKANCILLERILKKTPETIQYLIKDGHQQQQPGIRPPLHPGQPPPGGRRRDTNRQ
jgi:hypothetical protein